MKLTLMDLACTFTLITSPKQSELRIANDVRTTSNFAGKLRNVVTFDWRIDIALKANTK